MRGLWMPACAAGRPGGDHLRVRRDAWRVGSDPWRVRPVALEMVITKSMAPGGLNPLAGPNPGSARGAASWVLGEELRKVADVRHQ